MAISLIAFLHVGCGRTASTKEVLIKELYPPEETNKCIDSSNLITTSNSIEIEGTVAKIVVQSAQDDSTEIPCKITVYQSGSNRYTISNVNATALIYKGDRQFRLMSISGTMQLDKSSVFSHSAKTIMFYVDGSGGISFGQDTAISLGLIIRNIEKSEVYQLAKKAADKKHTDKAMNFILGENMQLNAYYHQLDKPTMAIFRNYFEALFQIRPEFVEDSSQHKSYQSAARQLSTELKTLKTGAVTSYSKAVIIKLEKLTTLIQAITIPIAPPISK